MVDIRVCQRLAQERLGLVEFQLAVASDPIFVFSLKNTDVARNLSVDRG